MRDALRYVYWFIFIRILLLIRMFNSCLTRIRGRGGEAKQEKPCNNQQQQQSASTERKRHRIRETNQSDVAFLADMSCKAMKGILVDAFGEHNLDLIVKYFEAFITDKQSLYYLSNHRILEIEVEPDKWESIGSFCVFNYDQWTEGFEYTEELYEELCRLVKRECSWVDGTIGQLFFWIEDADGGKFPRIFYQNEIYICFLSISELHRGQGWGKVLLEQVEQIAKSKKYHTVRLDVSVYNATARHVYRKHRYKEVCRHGTPGPTQSISLAKLVDL